MDKEFNGDVLAYNYDSGSFKIKKELTEEEVWLRILESLLRNPNTEFFGKKPATWGDAILDASNHLLGEFHDRFRNREDGTT